MTPTTMATPALLPCPFCGDTASLRDSTLSGIFVECDACDARGPCIEVERVGYPESMFTTVSTAPNGDTIEPPLRVVGRCNEEYYKFKKQATQKAEAAAAAAWNQRSAWQPIETAPRDGRDFIAYNEFTGPYITAAKVMTPDDEIRYPMYCWRGVKGIWFPEPTHWQPSPALRPSPPNGIH